MKLEGKHVMIDIETLGNGSNAVLISLGAVEFNAEGVYSAFYRNIDPQSCVDAGLKMDVSTVMWWMQQSDAARSVFKLQGEPLPNVLIHFNQWFPEDACVWGNGATFDNVILSNAYDACKIKKPWKYWADRCYRTTKALYPGVKPDPFAGTAHNALDDARHQALHLIRIASAA
jgi:exodeoxyribonuclease VIII